MRRVQCLFAVLLLVFGALPLLAQEQTAALEGVVSDQQGAGVPGVSVEAIGAGG